MLTLIGITIEIVGGALVVFVALVLFFESPREEEKWVLRNLSQVGMFMTVIGCAIVLIDMVMR